MPLPVVRQLPDGVDSSGKTYKVFSSDHAVAHDKAMSLYFKAFAYLLDRGWAISTVYAVKNEYRLIWLEDADGNCVGGVVWEWLSSIKQSFIILSFVDEAYKGRRLFNVIENALEDETIRLGGTNVAGNVHVDNISRLKAGERTGWVTQFRRLYKDLTPKIAAQKSKH